MEIAILKLRDQIDEATIKRGLAYAHEGHVEVARQEPDGVISARVSNGHGTTYEQQIRLHQGRVDGQCSCPVGHNCKHVVAALVICSAETSREPEAPAEVTVPNHVSSWIDRAQNARKPAVSTPPARPDDYPDTVKDRLLFILKPYGPTAEIDIYKGRINAAGTSFNKSIRRYDAMNALRSIEPAKFVRPVDVVLIDALARARLLDAPYWYGLPEMLLTKGDDAVSLLRRVADTGRMLHTNAPDAVLTWSERVLDPQLGWTMLDDGTQQLGFRNADGRSVEVRALQEAAIWVDADAGLIGKLGAAVDTTTIQLVEHSPAVAPALAARVGSALPDTLGSLSLPRPKVTRHVTREPRSRHARLIMGAASAHAAPAYERSRYWRGETVRLPVLSLGFVYEGEDMTGNDDAPRLVENDTVVTLIRDPDWEQQCEERLMTAGALPIMALEEHTPKDRMYEWDFAFADGELNPHSLELSEEKDALHFSFRTAPQLRKDGWEVIETGTWPYKLSDAETTLTIATGRDTGRAFQGNDWFSLGFKVDIGGKSIDIAPLVAAFLEQIRQDWDVMPDMDALHAILSDQPVYLDQGKAGYVGIDLSPLTPLFHLFLSHHAELGTLHPAEAGVAQLVEQALDGSTVRFADNAGILPLARSLEALSSVETFAAPDGLEATLRDYQAYGAAWMGSLMEAGFGAVLADDMGLGKTLQVLTLLQARRMRSAPGPALLIVPTSLLYGWQAQAAGFTPDLRLCVLHGPDRRDDRDAALHADLVITTYPLLTRDKDWLASLDWPLVILDEAQTLKNPASQTAKALREIPAAGRIALTGTPLENSLQDVWTLIDWVLPGLLGDRKTFQTTFRTPIEKHGDSAAQARLNRRLRPFMLRRTKEDVASELPPKTEIVERVSLPKSQQALYETVRSAMDTRVREAIGTRGLAAARITVLDALLKLRQVCCDPSLLKTDAARGVTDSAKRARLREQVAELVAEGRRVLVFSQFVEMLTLIENDLRAAGIPSLSLTGQTRNRAATLEAFAQGDAPVFLLSLKAGGIGLTLTEADTVILYDPWWNPAVERQAMDRTHRIGQTKPVFVHRLVAAGTVEEKILDMQARKQALADALFDPEADQGTDLLDEDTLQDLFAPLTE